jgi:ribonuclease HI
MSILSIVANAMKVKSKGGVARQRWCKPNPRHLKINVDGSFHSDSHAGSIGAVVRDYKGEFIAASTVFLPYILSPAVAEAMAMREGLSLANRMGCTNVIMESDSTETVDACNGTEAWWGESAAILADCVDLASLLNSVSFQHCPREANEVAHDLARDSFASKNSSSWVDKPPDFIICKLLNDVTVL